MNSPLRSQKPATSADVAARAGVSRSTVSNILNGNDSRFPEATRVKVHQAAEALRYQPSLAGRSLVSGRSDTIIVLLPNASFGSNLQDAVDQVMLGSRRIGGNVVVRFASDSTESTMDAVQALRPMALVDFGVLSEIERVALEEQNVIIVPSRPKDLSEVPDGGLARIQVQELLKRGPRRLVFAALSDKRFDPYGPGRFTALQELSITLSLPEPVRIPVSLTLSSGIDAMRAILELNEPVGVACYNDDVALVLLAAARELNISIPEQVSIMGVDNTFAGRIWSPVLSTIDTDMGALVQSLSEELRERLSGDDLLESAKEHRHFKLITGETT